MISLPNGSRFRFSYELEPVTQKAVLGLKIKLSERKILVETHGTLGVVNLSYRETAFVRLLAENKGDVQEYSEIIRRLWPTDPYVQSPPAFDSELNSIRDRVYQLVLGLRGKFQSDGAAAMLLETVTGRGYLMPNLPTVEIEE